MHLFYFLKTNYNRTQKSIKKDVIERFTIKNKKKSKKLLDKL